MAIDPAHFQSSSLGVPLVTELPLDQRTIESLGLPREVDRRDLLAFLSNQSARLATVVDPPLFRSLDGDIPEPMTLQVVGESSMTDEERTAFQGWIHETIGGSLATLDYDDIDQRLANAANLLEPLVRSIRERQRTAPADAGDEADDDVTDPALTLPDAPPDQFDDFFDKSVFESELKAMEDFDLGGWQKNLREIAKKGDPVAIILAIFAFVEARAGKVFKAFAADQVAQNDRLSAAADLAQKLPELSKQDPTRATALSQTLGIKTSQLQNAASMSMMRIREHLTAMSQIEQTLTSTKNVYHQTQLQGVVRRMT